MLDCLLADAFELARLLGNAGLDCALPSNATRVVRQGITYERSFWQRMENGVWSTGMAFVDAFLNAVNPQGLRRRPSIYSPDMKRYARSVGT